VVADSAAVLDGRFQVERDAINGEVRAMASGDRRSAAYARRYEAIQARTVAAESLRAVRDRVRRRATTLRPAGVPGALDPAEARRRLLGARAGSRRARTLRPDVEPISLRLEPGAWWLGVADASGVPATFTRVEVRPGARDTVRP
jgi:hypothetical protein